LAYIGRALHRLTTEVASVRDDMKVLTAIVLRHEETLIRVLEQTTMMVARTRGLPIGCARSRIGSTVSKTAGNCVAPSRRGV
jgi:hypothetical protein